MRRLLTKSVVLAWPLGFVASIVMARPAGAQVTVTPECGANCPGSASAQTVLNMIAQWGLWITLGGFLIAGGLFGLYYLKSNSTGMGGSQRAVLACAAGAFFIGLAPTAINLSYALA